MIKAILMDFNGVIINDEPIQMRAYQEILSHEGIALTENDYYECLGMDDVAFVEAAYKRAGVKPAPNKVMEIAQAKTKKWREVVANGVPLFDGLENFVRKMANEFVLGIVSMSHRDEVDHILGLTDLADCFKVIVSATDVSRCKPDPECYRLGFGLIDAYRTDRKHLRAVQEVGAGEHHELLRGQARRPRVFFGHAMCGREQEALDEGTDHVSIISGSRLRALALGFRSSPTRSLKPRA